MPDFHDHLGFGHVHDESDENEDCEWEVKFFEGIVASAPNYAEALSSLGNLYTRCGHYDKGLDIDRRLVRLRPEDPIVHYNLACSLSLLVELSEALAELEKAIALGYNDYAYMLGDEDLRNVRQDPRFFELMARFHKPV